MARLSQTSGLFHDLLLSWVGGCAVGPGAGCVVLGDHPAQLQRGVTGSILAPFVRVLRALERRHVLVVREVRVGQTVE